MSAQLPACQLLERFYGQSANLWPVAPPADAWLQAHSTAMISGDVALREHWASGGTAAASPFDAPFYSAGWAGGAVLAEGSSTGNLVANMAMSRVA